MNARRSAALIVGAVAVFLAATSPSGQESRPVQQPPAFKSGVTIVPLDVRVLDKNGRPITDLKREDFTILESGVPQTIAHFIAQVLAPDAPQPDVRAQQIDGSFDASPQNRRVFLILVGPEALRNAQLYPETLDALLRFVRDGLLPQDQVGLFAADRAVDLTTDHERFARILETYRVPATARKPALPRQDRPAAPDTSSIFAEPKALDSRPPVKAELGLEEYVKANRGRPLSELEAMFFAINYLRFIPGEKHLVFVTERGPYPTWDQVKHLTSAASHARVAIDTIQVGARMASTTGPAAVDVAPPEAASDESRSRPDPEGGRQLQSERQGSADSVSERRIDGGLLSAGSRTVDRPSEGLMSLVSFYDLRYVARQTGGQSSLLENTSRALDRVDTATRAQYLLAYYPSDGNWNGRYRSVTVEVNRPGATVLFRHGYFARSEPEVFDRRRVVTNNRIAAAGFQLDSLREIDIAFTPRFVKNEKGGGVYLTLRVDAARVAWSTDLAGRRTASLEVAVYCGDANQNIVGEVRRLVDIALTDESYQRASREGFFRDLGVPVTGRPRFVKVIVYDYEADRVGSAIARIK